MANDSAVKKDFLALSTFDDLAKLLGLTPKGLRYYCHTKPYKVFTLAKKAGGQRVISAPTGSLRTIQRRLAEILLDVYGGRAPVHGFAAGRSIKSNANPHVGREYVFNIDLANFFPSIHFGRVRGLFMSKPYSLPPGVATSLAQLTCYLGSLPQGAPTSPVVSNLICGGLDSRLKLLARSNKCRYTRYADDITFSCESNAFPKAIAIPSGTSWVPGPDLDAAITAEGFNINAKKTTMRRAGSRQVVTGLVVNERVNIQRSYLKAVRGMLGSLEQKGLAQAETDFHIKYEVKRSLTAKSFSAVLAGRINYIGFIKGWDSDVYLSFWRRAQKQQLVLRSGPVEISRQASRKALYDAIWLIDAGISEEYATQQSTGFSWGKYGIVTAAHAIGEYVAAGEWTQYAYVQVRRPHLQDGTVFKVKVLKVHPHADLALLEYPTPPLVSFRSAEGKGISPRDVVRILGFPHYHDGDGCTDQDFVVNATRVYSGIHHRVVVGSIITGNSGGPVLDRKNHVVGIALKGQQIPAHFSDKDSLSSFAIAETLDLLLEGGQASKH